MRHTLKYTILLFACCWAWAANAQSLDKYKALMDISNRSGVADSTFIRINMEIADAFLFNDPDTARYFVLRAHDRAKASGNLPQLARSTNFLGIIAFSKMH